MPHHLHFHPSRSLICRLISFQLSGYLLRSIGIGRNIYHSNHCSSADATSYSKRNSRLSPRFSAHSPPLELNLYGSSPSTTQTPLSKSPASFLCCFSYGT